MLFPNASIDRKGRTANCASASLQSTFSGSLVSSVGAVTMLVSTGSRVSAEETTSSCRYPMKPAIDWLALAGTWVVAGGDESELLSPPQADTRSGAASAKYMRQTADLRLVLMLLLLALRDTSCRHLRAG